MKPAAANSETGTVKLVIAAPALMHLRKLMESLQREKENALLRDYRLGNLEALRLEWTESGSGENDLVKLHALQGHEQYGALQEVLLSNADGVLIIIDMHPSQHDASLQTLTHCTDSLRLSGRELSQVPIVLLYHRCECSSADDIARWDASLEWESNGLERFCAHSQDSRIMRDVLNGLLRRVAAHRASQT
jgi:hypothetical protein